MYICNFYSIERAKRVEILNNNSLIDGYRKLVFGQKVTFEHFVSQKVTYTT